MDSTTELSISELKAILACDQSDGYLKNWAREKLLDMMYQIESDAPTSKVLVSV
jgi:hypothetical protein